MNRFAWILLLALTPALAAQEPDSGAAPPADQAEARQLREQIRQRWNERVRSTLGLTDDQAAKLQATEGRFEEQRQPIRARLRETNQALTAELESATPNQDRVRELMNQRQQHQLELQQVNRNEDREMQGYLTPVQRARYQEERRRFQEHVRAALQQRREQRRQMPARPRPRPRRRPNP